MNALLMTIDLMLVTCVIYYSVQIQNALWPSDGSGMTRTTRQWLTLRFAKYDHILMGAAMTGLHGLVALLLAIFSMPYATLAVCLCAGWNSARLMQALASIKYQRFSTY